MSRKPVSHTFDTLPPLTEKQRQHLEALAAKPDDTIDVVLRWDHLVCDAALIAQTLTRLEQVLGGEIAAELDAIPPLNEADRLGQPQTAPKGQKLPNFAPIRPQIAGVSFDRTGLSP